jgi:hypothetical protein
MSAVTTAPSTSRKRKKKPILAWVVVCSLAALVIGFIVARIAINSYLRSDQFRTFVERKTGESLRSQVSLQPFQFTGASIYAEGLSAQGSEASPFAFLKIDQGRIEISARRFFERVWQIDQIDIQRMRLNFDGPRLDLPPIPEVQSESAWLPNRVEVGGATIHSTNLQWSGGEITGTQIDIAQREGGWNFNAHGGRIRQAALPELSLESAKLRFRQPSLFIENADLRQAGGGGISLGGEVRFNENLDLQAKVNAISVTPLLPDDWRVRLTGNLNGDIRVQSALPLKGFPQVSGNLNLADGHLEALPVLDQIATFTGSAQFRHLALSKTAGDFTYDGVRLSVTNFELEAARLLRFEGAFTVENGQIDGRFQVGVTPPSLQWLPGAQERVFTVARNGYLWTPMHLTGPVSKPTEDLSPRLIAAAQGAIIDKAVQTVKPLQDAAKGLEDTAAKTLNQFLGN